MAQNTARLRGYSIRVSNAANVSANQTDECFIDSSSSQLSNDVIENNCEKIARYIWFYQPHRRDAKAPVLEICEVQIFGG